MECLGKNTRTCGGLSKVNRAWPGVIRKQDPCVNPLVRKSIQGRAGTKTRQNHASRMMFYLPNRVNPPTWRMFCYYFPGFDCKSERTGGLYLDYAIQAFYDGLTLLIASIMVSGLGGMEPVNPYRRLL